MIEVAVSCPQPPLLLPGVTGGIVSEVEDLRAAGIEAIGALRGCDVIVIVGAAPDTGPYDRTRPTPEAYYSPVAGRRAPADALPLSLGVGVTLIGGADAAAAIELWGIAADAPTGACAALGAELAARPERIGLLVMADGSARRGEKAPGHLDPRAVPYDEHVAQALADGDPAALLELDPGRAEELLVAGRAAWQVLAGAFAGRRPQARLTYSAAPFGVWYPVAVWTAARH